MMKRRGTGQVSLVTLNTTFSVDLLSVLPQLHRAMDSDTPKESFERISGDLNFNGDTQ
jgi:hypothetical protein